MIPHLQEGLQHSPGRSRGHILLFAHDLTTAYGSFTLLQRVVESSSVVWSDAYGGAAADVIRIRGREVSRSIPRLYVQLYATIMDQSLETCSTVSILNPSDDLTSLSLTKRSNFTTPTNYTYLIASLFYHHDSHSYPQRPRLKCHCTIPPTSVVDPSGHYP